MCVSGGMNVVKREIPNQLSTMENQTIETDQQQHLDRPARRISANRRNSTSSTEKKSKHRTYVKHDYHDHAIDPIFHAIETELIGQDEGIRRGPRGGVVVPFPERLYDMLKEADEAGFEDVVSWQPHGRCFVIHQPKKFVEEIMPRYFRQSKLTSFQRQVNLYGFRRLTAGQDRGGYYHELFLRGRPDLYKRMMRIRVKGTGSKAAASPATEPDFYSYPFCFEGATGAHKNGPSASPCLVTKNAHYYSHGFEEKDEIPKSVMAMPAQDAPKSFSLASIGSLNALVSNKAQQDARNDERSDIKPERIQGISSVDYRLLLQKQIEEINSDPLFYSFESQGGDSLEGSYQQQESLLPAGEQPHRQEPIRPLAAPRMLPNFQNFHSLPERDEYVHVLPRLCDYPTDKYCYHSDAFPQASCESSSTRIENNAESMVPVHHDPFKDQIGELIEDPMPHIVESHGKLSTEDYAFVLEGFLDPFFVSTH